MSKTKILICPYCGAGQPASDRCRDCGGLFEPLSRQATLNEMGPWYIRDPKRPYHPGCSYQTLVKLIERGRVTRTTIVRGPTTRQLWSVARHVNGVAHLLGYCHQCDASVDRGDHVCHACGAQFGAYLDRNYLGLPEIRPLPWEADLDEESRRTGGGRLSRFASDEELLDARHTRPRAAGPGDALDEQPAGAAGQGLAPGLAEAGVTRSLQRTVERQRGTIRLFAALFGATLVIAIASNATPLAARLSGLLRDEGHPDSPADAMALPTETPGAPLPADGLGSPGATGGDPGPGAPEQPAAPPAESPPVAAAAADAPGAEAPFAPAMGEAMRLIEAAEQAGRSLDDRIADYGRALAILEGMLASPGETPRPAGLQDTMDRVTKARDRLVLKKEFFGP